MLKNKFAGGLLTVAAVAALTTGAFAAASPSADKIGAEDDLSDFEVITTPSERSGMNLENLKTDENGDKYFELENGEKVYISFVDSSEAAPAGKIDENAQDAANIETGMKLEPSEPGSKQDQNVLTDENGDSYVLTEDGAKIYISKMDSAEM